MELRPSNYITAIRPNPGNEVLLVHGYSMCIDLATPRVASLLRDPDRTLKPGELDEKTQAYLLARGYLTGLNREQEITQFKDLVNKWHDINAANHYAGMQQCPLAQHAS